MNIRIKGNRACIHCYSYQDLLEVCRGFARSFRKTVEVGWRNEELFNLMGGLIFAEGLFYCYGTDGVLALIEAGDTE